MPPTTSSSKTKAGDRFKEGIAVKVFAKGAYGEGEHVLLGRAATADESCPADHAEHTFDDQRVFIHKDSAPHPVSWLHPA